jgi:GPH family glycoside/pentoside/hexuronide:cation symporter
MKEKRNTRGLTGWQKFFLSFPTMPGNLSVVLIHNAFLKYYTDIVGLDPKYVGIIYAVFGIWNAINDPAIGVWLDRYKYNEKKGKYVHIMKLTVPVTIFASFAMIFAQSSWHEWVQFAFLLSLLFIYDTSMTTFNIAYGNYKLLAAPANEDRVDIEVYITYIANIGGFLGTLIPTLLLVGNTDKGLTTILFSAVLFVNAILYYFALKPLKDTKAMYLKDNAQISERKKIFGDVFDNVKDAVKSKAFVTYIINQLLASGPRAFYFTPFLYMADYVLKLQGEQATVMDVSMGIALFIAAPFLGKLTKRLGLKNTMIWSSIPCAFSYLLLAFVNSFAGAMTAYIVMYIFSSAVLVPQGPMFGAIIDEDEQRTGHRKAGMFNGLKALLTIPVSGIQASLFMGIISAYGFAAGEKTQSAQALLGIKIGTGVLPFVFMLLSIIPLLFLPIDRKKELEISEFAQNRQRETVPMAGEQDDMV